MQSTRAVKENLATLLRQLMWAAASLAVIALPQFPVRGNQTQRSNGTASLRGRVIDAQTGEPIAKVKIITGPQHQTVTDAGGGWTLQGLAPGDVELYVTTVGYGLVRKTVLLKEGEDAELEVALSQEAATLTEQVTVTARPFEETETNAPSEHALNKTEIQTLASVLVSDPVRAAQALPGVTANDDFRSEFAVRGAGYRQVGVLIDGVLTDSFVHSVQGVSDTGSLSVLNADTISQVSLLPGAFPVKYGERSAAILNLETREGNRVKPSGRIAVSLVNASAVADGPFARGRGSWLAAVRKSYLNYVLQRFYLDNDDPYVFDLVDAQAKAAYDLTARHQIGLSFVYGESQLDRSRFRERFGPNAVVRGGARNWLANVRWTYTPRPQLFVQTRIFGLQTNFTNTNRDDLTLYDARRTQLGVRADLNFQVHRAHRIEAGVYVRSLRAQSFEERLRQQPQPAILRDAAAFDRRAGQQNYYLQDTWSVERLGLSLTGGGRIEHGRLTGATTFAPRAALGLALNERLRIRAAWGRYHQSPDFTEVLGRLGNPQLRVEHATHYNASVEQTFGQRTRLLAEVYDREERDVLFSFSEPRLDPAVGIIFPRSPFRNTLRGHARGIEVTLQRRSANNLAGWLAYSYTTTRYQDQSNSSSFVSDFDQRHAISAYASYRFTETLNVSGQWRYGSGLPLTGFFREDAGRLFLGSERNLVRLPFYSRLDLRVNKAFLFKKWKLTLSGEVLNALKRVNYRYPGFATISPGGEVSNERQKLLPFLPSAGV
ncbi:MAG: TonB-dependent receptor, partial [Pyrinomonadaceae bacterium]|nr:TonB-dependent receptor [Pyrinomonadaceae bacterium]